MEPISWSLNGIDTIFLQRHAAPGEPTCPDSTFLAGYVMDPWNKWNVICLGPLSVEDIEDVYIFGFMIAGILMIGLGMTWICWKIWKLEANEESPKLAAVIVQCCRGGADQVDGGHQKVIQVVDKTGDQSVDFTRHLDAISNMLKELSRTIETQTTIIIVTHLDESDSKV